MEQDGEDEPIFYYSDNKENETSIYQRGARDSWLPAKWNKVGELDTRVVDGVTMYSIKFDPTQHFSEGRVKDVTLHNDDPPPPATGSEGRWV